MSEQSSGSGIPPDSQLHWFPVTTAWQAFSVECGDEPPCNLPLVGVVLRTGNDPEGRAAVNLLWPWPAHGRARVAWSTFGLKIGFPQFQGIRTIDDLV